jgi:LysR family glycine cleavage system transcriptional activator
VRHPWLHWKTWFEVERIADLKPAGTLTFSGYEQIIPSAVAGHGVALGRTPLVKDLLAAGDLVAPFKSEADPARAYFAIVSKGAASRPEVADFVEWLKTEARG